MVYGKIFESLFTGSMFGCGAVRFAVWSYVIANTKPSQNEAGEDTGIVEINPPVLAAALGEPVQAVQEAIAYLMQPDPVSRNPAHDGRRLLHVGSFLYEVPSFPIYQRKQNSDERKAAVRERVRAHRERKKGAGNVVVTRGNARNDTQTQYSDSPNSTQSTPPPPKGGARRVTPDYASDERFVQMWAAYGRDSAKKLAWERWKRLNADDDLFAKIMDGIAHLQKAQPESQYRPHLERWLRDQRWDERPPIKNAGKPTSPSQQVGESLRAWMDQPDD